MAIVLGSVLVTDLVQFGVFGVLCHAWLWFVCVDQCERVFLGVCLLDSLVVRDTLNSGLFLVFLFLLCLMSPRRIARSYK